MNKDPEQLKAVQDFLQGRAGHGRHLRSRARRRRTPPAPDPAEAARRPAEPRLSQHLRRRRGVDELRRRADLPRRAAPRCIAPLDKVDAVVRRGESVRARGRRAHAQGRPLLPRRHRRRVRRLGRARGDRRQRPHDPPQRRRRRTAARGRSSRARTSTAACMLDEHGNPINKRNAWAARSVAYVRLIPPGAADTIHYRLQIPADAGDRITCKAKVNYRKFAWWNTQWAFAGVRDPAQPDVLARRRRTTTASWCSRRHVEGVRARSRRFRTSRRR